MSYTFSLGVMVLLVQCHTLRAACGGQLSALAKIESELTSPNYPQKYPDDTQCIWRITSAGSTVNITVLEYSLEGTNECRFDSLQIYVDSTKHELCGKSTGPLSYISKSKDVFVVFISDTTVTSQGFRLTYQATRSISACLGKVQNLTADVEHHTLQSPGYTAPASKDQDNYCEWNIEAERGFIEINVEEYNIDGTALCSAGSLEIYNARDDPFPVSRLCGSSTEKANLSIWTDSGRAYVRLHYDSTVIHRQFKLWYKMVNETFKNPDCHGGEMVLMASEREQTLQSPGYPNNYPNLQDCLWRLESPLDYIEVTMEDFNLHRCSNDTLVITDYLKGTPIATLRGTADSKLRVFLRSSDDNYIHFYSDVSGTARGFRLTYKAVTHSANEEDDDDREDNSFLIYILISACSVEFLLMVVFIVSTILCGKRRSRKAIRTTNEPRTDASHTSRGRKRSVSPSREEKKKDRSASVTTTQRYDTDLPLPLTEINTVSPMRRQYDGSESIANDVAKKRPAKNADSHGYNNTLDISTGHNTVSARVNYQVMNDKNPSKKVEYPGPKSRSQQTHKENASSQEMTEEGNEYEEFSSPLYEDAP